jgi:hypothetical protein
MASERSPGRGLTDRELPSANQGAETKVIIVSGADIGDTSCFDFEGTILLIPGYSTAEAEI